MAKCFAICIVFLDIDQYYILFRNIVKETFKKESFKSELSLSKPDFSCLRLERPVLNLYTMSRRT